MRAVLRQLLYLFLFFSGSCSAVFGQSAVTGTFSAESVLENGTWIKIAVQTTGIYKISYEDLSKYGINPSGLDPRNFRIFGNGGGMLPESNASPRTDDLRENPIFVAGESDGSFDPGDYFLFYGESPDDWIYNQTDNLFRHRKNIYTDFNYYFFTFNTGPGKRISDEQSTSLPATDHINTFNDFFLYEKDDLNLIKSGREWYDKDLFDLTTSRSYSFSIPNKHPSIPATIVVDVAARSTAGATSFRVSVNDQQLTTLSVPSVSGDYLDNYARKKTGTATFSGNGPLFTVKLDYIKTSSGQTGWLNYIAINAVRLLSMSGNQMSFRSVAGSGPGRVTEYTLSFAAAGLMVWDVTDKGNIRRIHTTVSGSSLTFRLATDTVREFIAFDGGSFLTPEYAGMISNQNLHGSAPVDYVIVSHPAFLSEAERLAGFHRAHSNLSVQVTTTEKVYNEFSSGKQDITAIRDFLRMLYERAEPGNRPRYLLLFGDASYDYKARISGNTNFVPAFQSSESLNPIDSYVTDDYFVILGIADGLDGAGDLQAGIGRLPVTNLTEATQAVNKIIHYCENSDKVKNDWRTTVCFVADDQDEGGNIFIRDSETLADLITENHPVYNIDKIYLDAYTQVSTPGGNRYPEVNEAINKRVEKGALIMNYIGHGGEVGWAHERVLEVPDINGWRNFNNMPVFMTATCEFSRYDDPGRVSAGEYVFLNPSGGGIALFTTTRATFAGSNAVLSKNFYETAFDRFNGQFLKMGDIIMIAKNNTGANANVRKFVLLGDPALQMAYPDLDVATTEVYTSSMVKTYDTIRALSEVTIGGEIRDLSGNTVESFNGTLFPTVLDKPSELVTRGNDGGDPYRFYLYRNPLYKGQVQVTDGKFSFSFIVPKDIAYQYGHGRISYYARNADTDAAGYDNGIVVGGFNDKAIPDDSGPLITLFMNDRNFRPGGVTDRAPYLLADVSDESGINTVGNGIGHDITAVLDGNTTEPMILNEYYVAGLGTYKSGVITYPLAALSEGEHTITLKVWDVFNNSSEATLSFVVMGSDAFELRNLMVYPNPFRDHTTFSFETNQSLKELDVEIRVFSLFGELVTTMHKKIYANGYRIEPMQWDGTATNGMKINSGTYVYRITVTLPDGSVARESSKLVFIR